MLLTTRNYDDGAGIYVDSLTPGVPQTITIVTGRPFRFLARSNLIVQITTGGTMVGSFAGIADGGSFNMTFTPPAPTATISITQLPTVSHGNLQLHGIYLPRVDSFVSENVVTLVCDEDKYHYGYNGQLKDNQWAGNGNHLDFRFRGYDPRIGRFASIDPLAQKYPWNGSYNFAEDRVIDGKDLEGKEWEAVMEEGQAAWDEMQPEIQEEWEKFEDEASKAGDKINEWGQKALDYLRTFDGIQQAHPNTPAAPAKQQPVVRKADGADVEQQADSKAQKGTQNPKVKEALNKGNKAHTDFKQKAGQKGWTTNPRLKDPETGETVIPDAVTKDGKPVELKPNTPSGKAKGASQLPKYERATGKNGRVITYDPKKY